MAEEKKSAVEQRLDNAIYGTPKIKPDEQRRYLGTFRERVCLTISVAELHEQDWTAALQAELNRKIGNLVFINGNLSREQTHPYVQTAARAGAAFTMKTEPEFKTSPDSMAVVVAGKTAVYQSPVDVKRRYPKLVTEKRTETEEKKSSPKHRRWYRIFHRGN